MVGRAFVGKEDLSLAQLGKRLLCIADDLSNIQHHRLTHTHHTSHLHPTPYTGIYNQRSLFLETKERDEDEWPMEEAGGGLVVRVIRIRPDNLEFDPAVTIKLPSPKATLGDLKRELASKVTIFAMHYTTPYSSQNLTHISNHPQPHHSSPRIARTITQSLTSTQVTLLHTLSPLHIHTNILSSHHSTPSLTNITSTHHTLSQTLSL